jgi:hypothetical protein
MTEWLEPAASRMALALAVRRLSVSALISESFCYPKRLILCPRFASYHRRGLALSAVTNREQGRRSLKTSSNRFRREDRRVKLESQPRNNSWARTEPVGANVPTGSVAHEAAGLSAPGRASLLDHLRSAMLCPF